ncbi:MAG: hypothetical protein MUO76_17155, partial [Anaerolineaceae bacterium]|nr:hypothetical protein [Anaerolineaceae bacterium]
SQMIKRLRQSCEGFPDLRTGKNSIYDLPDVGMSAFSKKVQQLASFPVYAGDRSSGVISNQNFPMMNNNEIILR